MGRACLSWQAIQPKGTKTMKRINIPGYPSVRTYGIAIADDVLKRLLSTREKYQINFSQHVLRIEKGFDDDSKKLYHIAKGIIYDPLLGIIP